MIINTDSRDISVAFFIYSRCLKRYMCLARNLSSASARKDAEIKMKYPWEFNIFRIRGNSHAAMALVTPPHSFRATPFVVVVAVTKRASYVQIETRSASLH